jgi:hypothetical protein
MTRDEPRRSEAWPASAPADEATELRWFADGRLPGSVRTWFAGPPAAAEERCDRYLLDGAADIGIKVRGGRTLELKARRGVGARIELAGGPGGCLEEWAKWSPADDLVEVPGHARWISVRKAIAKRRFAVSGEELPVTVGTPGGGCDVQVTSLSVGPMQAWTFAFAASGPRSTRDASLRASWRALTASVPVPGELLQGLRWSMGYPQWLAGILAAGSLNGSAAVDDPGGRAGASTRWQQAASYLLPGRVG